jgi:hypothetical protein
MGQDWSCGCRISMGHWFLCKNHENLLIEVLSEDEKQVENEPSQ